MSSGRAPASLVIYALFALLAWAWRASSGQSPLHDGAPLGTTHAIALPLALSLGALSGALVAWASRELSWRTRWGRGLHGALRDNLAGTAARVATVLAVAAAIGEELLFRGAILPSLTAPLGLVGAALASSALFALLHIPWSRALVPWTVMAFAMGLLFAALFLLTGEVLASVTAHAVINHENLRFLLAGPLATRSAPARAEAVAPPSPPLRLPGRGSGARSLRG